MWWVLAGTNRPSGCPKGNRGLVSTSPLPARSRAEVDGFYHAALAAGGRDNGAPGLRPQYHPDYYGGFVPDPDGNNVEAVCHLPQ